MKTFDVIQDTAAWLLTPISGNADHFVSPGVAWHGRLMVLAWLILMPPLVLIARFYKVTPKQDWPKVLDNPFWLIAHRKLGYLLGGCVLASLGAVIWSKGIPFILTGTHAWLGWIVAFLALVQIVSAFLRGSHGGPMDPFTRQKKPPEQWPGDHYCMTRRRIVFEYVHKYTGYALVPLVTTALATGLHAADAPRWMWIASPVMLLAFCIAFVRLQIKGRCIDTYQAIWGTDSNLPGNRRERAIGWGIKRVLTQSRTD